MQNSLLVLGCKRSGTTSLGLGLTKQLKGSYIGEPFRSGLPNYEENCTTLLKDLPNRNNIVLKTLLGQKPKYFDKSLLSFFTYLIDLFGIDNTVLIGRKNFDEHVISHINLYYQSDLSHRHPTEQSSSGFFIHNKHHIYKPWRLKDIPKEYLENKKLIEKAKDNIKLHQTNLFQVSKIFNKEITWYEDLYGKDRDLSLSIIKSWNFNNVASEELNNYLHPKYKYNKTGSTKLI
jgi:hypothetical protein